MPPRQLHLRGSYRVIDLSCGFYHTACVTDDGGALTVTVVTMEDFTDDGDARAR